MEKNTRTAILFLFIITLVCFSSAQAQETFQLTSPDKRTEITITVDDNIQYSVTFQGKQILEPSALAMDIRGAGVLGQNPNLTGQERNSVDTILKPVIQRKSSEIIDKHNELELSFEGNYSVVFRAYNEGVAYRFKTDLPKDNIIVNSEELEFNFAGNHNVYFPEEESFMTHQERTYLNLTLNEIGSDRFSSIPALVDIDNGPKILISEADLQDYPGYYLQGTGSPGFTGIFPNVATEEKLEGDRNLHVTERADYIAKTNGSRAFPWRMMVIAENDGDLITNQLVYKLAQANQLDHTSWINPGKVAWDWWNANNIYGVDFRAGVNTETYKYYIDFAAEMGLDYIILDEGWYELGDLTSISEGMDIQELVDYGKSKDVGIVLWVVWKTMEDQWDVAFDQFEEWGVKGIKVDFMQRDDQWMVNWYWKVAREAAQRKLLVDFHGSYKPSGLGRTYPNVITREGVKGMEHNKWSEDITPEHNLTLPFIRMAAGPMDYTPGAMINATPQNFRDVFNKPMAMGTRAHELAKYVVYESPLQMLCDSPSHYYEQEVSTLEYLSSVPVTWDETRVLDAKVADHVLLARRKGDTWYVAAMTDENSRNLTIDFSFLGDGNYTAEIFKDGINADRYASDYIYTTQKVTADTDMNIDLVSGGGWVGVIRPSK